MNTDEYRIKEMFDFIDQSKTNVISSKDLEFAFIGLGSSMPLKKVKELIGAKTKLNYNEFLALCKENIQVAQLDQQLIEAFKLLEAPNKKGYFLTDDLRSILEHKKYSDKEIELMIKEANPTDDGYISIRSFTSELLK